MTVNANTDVIMGPRLLFAFNFKAEFRLILVFNVNGNPTLKNIIKNILHLGALLKQN